MLRLLKSKLRTRGAGGRRGGAWGLLLRGVADRPGMDVFGSAGAGGRWGWGAGGDGEQERGGGDKEAHSGFLGVRSVRKR